MDNLLDQYRSLEGDLIHVRWVYGGLESAEEDPILDKMEELWHDLSPQEQGQLNSEGTKSLISETLSTAPRELVDVDAWAQPGSAVREYVDR